MRSVWGLLLANVMVFVFVSVGYADLIVIGTATYMGSDYNLIWDDDNNGKSVVWLDYTNDADTWANQMAWATNLGDDLAINLDGYTVEWDEDEWRLPTTVDGVYEYGYDGTTTGGYNITSSEMGHLYYEELGNLGYYDINGNNQSGYGLQETGDFENLIPSWYWSGTEYTYDPDLNQGFSMALGFQGTSGKSEGLSGLAVRSGQVSAVPLAVYEFYYTPRIMHRVYEDQAPINRLGFEIKDDFGDFGSESTVTDVALKYPDGSNVTLGDLTYEEFIYYRSNFNPDTSEWSYNSPILYKDFNVDIESPLVIGTYTIEVTMENGQLLTTTTDFDFLLDLPKISSRSFQIQTDSSGNVHWTWQIPKKLFTLAKSYDLLVRPGISAYSGGKVVALYYPSLPVEVGYAITPSSIFQELVDQADEIKFSCQVRTNNNNARSNSKYIKISNPSSTVSIVPKKTAVVIPLN